MAFWFKKAQKLYERKIAFINQIKYLRKELDYLQN